MTIRAPRGHIDVDLCLENALVSYRNSDGDHYFVIDGFDDDGKETLGRSRHEWYAKEGIRS